VNAPANTAAMPQRAIAVQRRVLWTMLALLPGAALTAWFQAGPFLAWLGGALLLEICLPTNRSFSRQPRNPAALLRIALVALWLSSTAQTWALPTGLLAILAIEFAFDGHETANPFHPAMLACALVLTFSPALPSTSFGIAPASWIAVAYALGGIAMIVTRRIRWQAPLAMLASGAIVIAGWSLVDPSLPRQSLLPIGLPVFVLTAFFVSDDPPRACMDPRARMVSGLIAGILAMAAALGLHSLHRDQQVLPVLASTILLMNAAAPWLDAICGRQLAAPDREKATSA
jgi:Na+-translocating ferredoxin:NAD+ oxidoreductase RnfD subunit